MTGSWHDPYRGVVCLVSAVDGSVAVGTKVRLAGDPKNSVFEVKEAGVLLPKPHKIERLRTGQVLAGHPLPPLFWPTSPGGLLSPTPGRLSLRWDQRRGDGRRHHVAGRPGHAAS
jgi:hypothetical protein